MKKADNYRIISGVIASSHENTLHISEILAIFHESTSHGLIFSFQYWCEDHLLVDHREIPSNSLIFPSTA